MESSVAGIRSDLNKLNEHNNAASKQFAQLDKRITAVEETLKTQNEVSVSSDSIISEIVERQKGEAKVIALNIPESMKPVGVDRSQDDRNNLATLVPQELVSMLPKIKLRRLGKAIEGKTRPLLIEASSATEAKKILNSTPSENSTVVFKHYVTASQQQHLNEVRAELDNLIHNGDNTKTIKYINGVPKIVEKHSFRPRKKMLEKK